MPALTGAWSSRRRAWLLAVCAALLVVTFLLGWTAYAANGLRDLGRKIQLAPGQVATARGAEYRLVSLVRTDEVRPEDLDEGEPAAANAAWVVAVVEVTRREPVEEFYCSFALVGPDRRQWEPDPPLVSRPLSSACRAEEMPVGQPVRIETIYAVPDRFVNQIYGVAVIDLSTRRPTQVLRPG